MQNFYKEKFNYSHELLVLVFKTIYYMKNKSGSSRIRTRLNGFSVRRIHHVCQRSIIILNTQLFYLRSIKAPQFEEVTPDLSLFCLCYADKTLHHRPTNSSYQQLSTCVRGAGRTRTCSPIKERIYSPRGYQLPVTSPIYKPNLSVVPSFYAG